MFRAMSTPAIQIHESHREASERPPFPRSSSTYSGVSSSSARPMPISNAHLDSQAPPPLPPPTYIEDLDRGLDPGWAWGNSGDGFEFGRPKLAPIREGSSLRGGYMHRPQDSRSLDERSDTEMDLDGPERRTSSVSTLRSLGDMDHHASGGSNPTAFGTSYQLQGELPLAQRTLEHSSNEYDKHLLSKISISNSPSSLRTGPRNENLSAPRSYLTLDQHVRGDSSPLNSTYPQSGLSPSTRPGWKDYTGFSGPPSAGTAPSSAQEMEHWHNARHRENSRHSTNGSVSGLYEETYSTSSRSHRSSYDQGFPLDVDMDQPTEETKAFRQLHLEDRSSSQPESRGLGLGQKRRRRSGSRERMHDPSIPPQLNTSLDSGPRAYPAGPFPRSPNAHHQPHHGSISSVSSVGLRHGSYASSAGFSVGGSSITSFSSFDKSPGGLSPRSDVDALQDSPYVLSTPISQNISSLPTRTIKPATHPDSKTGISLPSKGTAQSVAPRSKGSSKAVGAFVCACCPKKPKRFTTADELRHHTTEKQYGCAYCGNRFKNKNEAERHQNSLHLRLHSWSCAAMSGPEAAFHPVSGTNASGSGFSPFDSCGFCGDEFPNSPQPDWAARKQHLVVVHKFRECNKAKKFYRADHFRQHLKHSHAGTSGKWTNMLENACMKDEPSADEVTSPGGDEAGLTPTSGVESVSTPDEENDDL